MSEQHRAYQRDRILNLLFSNPQGLTRNQLEAITKGEGERIAVNVLCRRLRELEKSGMVSHPKRRICPESRAGNWVYQLTPSMRETMRKIRRAA